MRPDEAEKIKSIIRERGSLKIKSFHQIPHDGKNSHDDYVAYTIIEAVCTNNAEDKYREARKKGVVFVRFDGDTPPKVKKGKDKALSITVMDQVLGAELTIDVDYTVLATAMVPPSDIEETAKMFSLTRSGDGFFNPEHIKLAPLSTHTAGIMIAGAAQAAKNAHEAAIDASGAAAKAVGLMARGEVEIESTVARVVPEMCSACHTCVTACPYGAIEMDESGDADV